MINPARGSRWSIIKDGKDFKLTIDGIWASGTRDKYRAVAYDVKYDHLEQIQTIPAEKLISYIQMKVLVHLASEENKSPGQMPGPMQW